jgi:glycosyltransferase involved in cell wall biosynthesis
MKRKTRILRFFQSVSQGLNSVLADDTVPIVLAGVESLLPIYREASSYRTILQDSVTGNPGRENLKDLHEQAWKIAKPLRKEKGWQKEKVLISVGRLAPEKNWDTLLRAFARVYPRHSELRLVLICDGPARTALETLAAELGVADRITFLGSLPFESVPCYLKAADAFVFASVTETQGLVTMEAMAAGLPIVAVNGSGTRDIVEHGKQGFLVENDPKALAKGIQELLANPQRAKRFSNNALEKAKTFDVVQLGKQTIKVYKQAIRDKKANRFVKLRAAEETEDALIPAKA